MDWGLGFRGWVLGDKAKKRKGERDYKTIEIYCNLCAYVVQLY